MRNIFRNWVHRYFSDEEAVILLVLLIVAFAIVLFFGLMLAPVLAAMVFAFLLQGSVSALQRWGMPQGWAVSLVFSLFLTLFLATLFILMPLLWEQLSKLFGELPRMLQVAQSRMQGLADEYPAIFSDEQLRVMTAALSERLSQLGQWFVSFSISALPGFVGLMIYLILVPILVLFMLKDKQLIMRWLGSIMPVQRQMLTNVAEEMNSQVANYVRGKAIEIVIVGFATYIGFIVFDLNYAALLALLVGLSVVVPYIGAAVVTIPVALIGFFQWGWSNEFMMMMAVYGVIQALDGNVLVPLLFSEAVNLHPIAIIIAVLVFGGLWGFWGVFFAIPLATLLKAVINAWPRSPQVSETS